MGGNCSCHIAAKHSSGFAQLASCACMKQQYQNREILQPEAHAFHQLQAAEQFHPVTRIYLCPSIPPMGQLTCAAYFKFTSVFSYMMISTSSASLELVDNAGLGLHTPTADIILPPGPTISISGYAFSRESVPQVRGFHFKSSVRPNR